MVFQILKTLSLLTGIILLFVIISNAQSEYPNAIWKPLPSKNYGGARESNEIDTIIIHATDGHTAQDAFDALLKQGVSVHYVVDKGWHNLPVC